MISSLQELCEFSLVRNYRSIEGTGNIPYRLLHKVLKQMKKDQVCKLESKNVMLIFEDDELWLQFLKNDFSTSVHDSFTIKKDSIRNFYLTFLKEHDEEFYLKNELLIETTLNKKIVKDPITNKYLIPYRMLYLRYELDEVQKAEESAQRLRTQMKEIQKEREAKQTIQVDHSFYINNKPSKKNYKNSYQNNRHSDIFNKSLKEHHARIRKFKDGGFDVTKNNNRRLAFGGQAGRNCTNYSTRENLSTKEKIQSPILPKAEQLNTEDNNQKLAATQDHEKSLKRVSITSTPPPKRRVRSTSIFLNKKRTLNTNRSLIKAPMPSTTRNASNIHKSPVVKASTKTPPLINSKSDRSVLKTQSIDNISITISSSGKKKKSGIFTSSKTYPAAKHSGSVSRVYIHDKSSSKN